MSPYPLEPIRSVGPMRLVLTTYPTREAALSATTGAVERRLAACGNLIDADSRYRWRGKVVAAHEVLVVFKTVPKRVGALFRYLKETHPYEVPEIAEIDVPRVDPGYLRYLATTIDSAAPPPPLGGGTMRRAGRRGPAVRGPARTRARHRRPSR